ncbi:hypothetical protein HDR63_03995 [bacterium]|nr:hypothetical protein [bacterium]
MPNPNVGLFATNAAWAVVCEKNDDVSNCSSYQQIQDSECGIEGITKTCTACKSGYVQEKFTVGYQTGYKCVKYVCSSSNCSSDSSWSSGGTGYQKKVNRGCSNNSCVTTSTSYRCAAGYYGAATTNTVPTCTRCPTVDGVTGTSADGATSQSGCYIPSGTTGNDTTGSFTYTANSYYCG